MRRKYVAAAAQVVGMTVAICGAFALSVGAGLLAAGTCLFIVALDLEAG